MSIKDFLKKSKYFLDENNDIFIAIIIIFVAFGSFGLGRLSKNEELKAPLKIEDMTASVLDTTQTARKTTNDATFNKINTAGYYVASKTGKKYHFPWCNGAKRIKESNKIIFKTKEAAEKAGYTPAGNCKGLK